MIEGFDSAVLDIRGELADEIAWLTPADEKHFDPVTAIVTLAGVMLTAFLAGFTSEAKKAAEGMGERTFQYLESRFKAFFAGKPGALQDDLDALAQEAPKLAPSVSRNDVLLYASQAEGHIRVFLEANMPSDRANLLATEVRKAALNHVLLSSKS
jgi:hypothetical protein